MGGAVKGLMNRPFGLFRWYYYGRSEVGGSDHAAMRAERAGAHGHLPLRRQERQERREDISGESPDAIWAIVIKVY